MVTMILFALAILSFSAATQAACSSYYNFATINEIHRSGNNTRFIEVKILDAGITSATYDNWTLSFCSVIGCTSVSLSQANDTDLPYIVIEKPEIPNRFHMGFGDGTLEGGDYLLTDGNGDTIDYFSVNDFRNQWWGGNEQYDSSCTPAFNWEFPGTNTHTISRLPDGTGDWSDAAGNSGDTSESSTNDNTPAPDGGVISVLSSSNATVTAGQAASFVVSLSDFPKTYDVTFDYTTIDSTAVAGTDYTSTSGTASILAGASQATINVPTSSGSSGGVSFIFFILNPVNATIVSNVSTGTITAGASVDHFLISHDGTGISCLAETITVTAKNADDTTYTGYTGAITLDTQSGNGTWVLNTGNGTFSDATADDGLAIYTFAAADNGVATFDLSYTSGTASIDVDAYDGTIRDDDTEGNLVFSPSGFTVTEVAISNPPPGAIDTSITAQTAATDFTLYLAAYGQTATDPTCGIIESYTSAKNLNFWSAYNNPNTGTLSVSVNGSTVATSEGASSGQAITFTNGQASFTTNYPDAGQITLSMKDAAEGIIGASDAFVVKPADFVLSNIIRSSDSFANPAAANAAGTVFMASGNSFTVTVTAVNSVGDTTPNYGQETVPETVVLTPTVVLPAGGSNGLIGFTTGFDGFVNGVDTGTDFYWDEVGIMTLTPSVVDYLADVDADVTGTATGNIGRFIPDHFTTTVSNGSFANTCAAFTYLGEPFGYSTNPTVIVTAENTFNNTTTNYTGNFALLLSGGIGVTYPDPAYDNTQLDQGGVNPIAVTMTAGSLSRTDNANGTLTFTLGGTTADSFVYDRSLGQVVPFTADLSMLLTAVNDGETTANDLGTPKDITPAGNQQRFGRGVAQDVFSVNTTPVVVLTMPVRTEYYDGAVNGWVTNTLDSCTAVNYTNVDNDITTSITPASGSTVVNGVGDLAIQLDADAGVAGGSTLVTITWPAWLGGTASATASFGVFQGDDRYLYWSESP